MKPFLLFSVTLSSDFLIAGMLLILLLFTFIPLLANAMRPRLVVVDFSKLVDGCVSIVVLLIIMAIAINWLLHSNNDTSHSERFDLPSHEEQISHAQQQLQREVKPQKKVEPQTGKEKRTQKEEIKKAKDKMKRTKQFQRNNSGYYTASASRSFRKARDLQRKAQEEFPDKKIELKVYPRKDSEG